MPSKNYLTDIIKYFAAILVIFSHSFSLSENTVDWLEYYSKGGTSFGALAVSILFCISGFYITMSLDKKGDKKFVKKRVLRLIPSLFIVVLLCIIFLGVFFSSYSFVDYYKNPNIYLYFLNSVFIPIHNLPGVFLNNVYGSTVNGALWTMPVQVLCYIYVFILYKIGFVNSKKINVYFIISLILSFVGYFIINVLGLTVLQSMIRPFISFCIGCFLYHKTIKNNTILYIVILSIVCILLNNYYSINLLVVACIPLFLIFLINKYFVSTKKQYNFSVLNSSYELYLVGFPVQQSVVSLFGGYMNCYLNFIISIVICIILAYFIKMFSDMISRKLIA